MGTEKEANAHRSDRPADDAPPAYEPSDPGPSTAAAGPSAAPSTGTQPAGIAETSLPPEKSGHAAGPTVDAPFNFPSEGHPPPYSPAGPSRQRPIAIPQTSPAAASGFVPVYAPALLNHGVPPDTWGSFLDTLSAFLTAKVSDRAVAHAADMGRRFTEAPKNAVKNVASHATHVGKGIGDNLKRGKVISAAFGVVGGAVSIPVSAALGVASSAVQLPSSAVSAVARKPQTPRERAVAYLAVANKDWFLARGLRADLVDSAELSQVLGVDVMGLVAAARDENDESVERQLGNLEGHIEKVEVQGSCLLTLGPKTLWLMLTKVQPGD